MPFRTGVALGPLRARWAGIALRALRPGRPPGSHAARSSGRALGAWSSLCPDCALRAGIPRKALRAPNPLAARPPYRSLGTLPAVGSP